MFIFVQKTRSFIRESKIGIQQSVDQAITFKYLEINITSNRKNPERRGASANDQSSHGVWLPTRYNPEKQIHELKEQDKDAI